MFEQGGTVEPSKPFGVAGEVCGHPIEDDADIVVVAGIDEVLKIFRCTVPARGSKISKYLITPGLIERMLQYRHQLDVCVAQIFDIRDQGIREFEIAQRTVPVFGDTSPRTGMELIDR